MASYSTVDAGRLLKVRVHVIRYWEKEMPLIQPLKDAYGRRVYSDRDLQILFRLKYLLYERRFTLEGARAQLYSELTGERQDLRGKISALRSELLNLLFHIGDVRQPIGVSDKSVNKGGAFSTPDKENEETRGIQGELFEQPFPAS